MGLLKIRVRRGINLVVRDTMSSDPYVTVSMGTQVSPLISLPPLSFSFAIFPVALFFCNSPAICVYCLHS